MARAAAVRHNMSSMGLTAAPPRLGARRTAGRKAESTGLNTLALTDVVSVSLGDFHANPLRSELLGRPGMAEFPAELRRFLGTQHDNLTYVSLVNSAVLNAKLAHAPDDYLSTSTHTVYAAPEFRRRRRLSFVALEGTQDGFTEEWIAQLLLLFRLPDGTELAYVQFLVEDEERAGVGPLFGNPGCAPLVWERVGADERYSYAVTPLDTLIRREFIVPDLSNVYAVRRSRNRRGQGARVRSMYCSSGDSDDNDDDEVGSSDCSSDGESEEVDAVALERMLKDEPSKRWPRWIRNPFIWGFEARHEPSTPQQDAAGD